MMSDDLPKGATYENHFECNFGHTTRYVANGKCKPCALVQNRISKKLRKEQGK